MYTLDIETMRQIMQKHKQTGHLHADLPSGVPSLRETCHVEIALKDGKMVSCSIASSQHLLTGDKAYKELTRLGRIHWTFVPSSPPVTQPRLPSHSLEKKARSRPRRIVEVEPWQMRSWPRQHKLVYELTDGTRNVQEIAKLLSTTPKEIEEILIDLQRILVIQIE